MDLCVKETLCSLHLATRLPMGSGWSPPQEALCVTQIRGAVLLAPNVKVE